MQNVNLNFRNKYHIEVEITHRTEPDLLQRGPIFFSSFQSVGFMKRRVLIWTIRTEEVSQSALSTLHLPDIKAERCLPLHCYETDTFCPLEVL